MLTYLAFPATHGLAAKIHGGKPMAASEGDRGKQVDLTRRSESNNR
jgi:hypothetical protein